MTDTMHAAVAIAIMAAITYLLRASPFLIFREGRAPAFVQYLARHLPFAIIGMLVVYCLKDVSFLSMPFGIPEIAAVLLVVVLHVWRRNTLLSIVSGTACYMLLIHFIA